MITPPRASFPTEFDFGVATSAYQIEGHRHGGAGRTHWDDFAATPGNVINAETGQVACDHVHRFAEDLDLVRDGHFNAYRFSTSWARILPDGRGTVNQTGLDYYDRLVDAMLQRGLKPCATLYHWELPSALADLGGWRNSDITHWFADFATIVMDRIGDRTHSVATINEPWCVSFLSHFLGHHAPGLRDIRATARAMHHVLLAHGRAVQALRAQGVGNLGAVFNLEWATPASNSQADRSAADTHDAYYNRFFMDGVFHKSYPKAALVGLEPHLPQGWQADFDVIGEPVDWCGINYYTRKRVCAAKGPWPHLAEAPNTLPETDMGWEIYPQGLYDFLHRTAREYTGDLPIFVTENGMAHADTLQGGVINDGARIAYLSAHLEQVKRAIDEGVPVGGYFVWSLLDNYEWALGYGKRFGLVHVDFETQKRTPKASYNALRAWLTQGDAG